MSTTTLHEQYILDLCIEYEKVNREPIKSLDHIHYLYGRSSYALLYHVGELEKKGLFDRETGITERGRELEGNTHFEEDDDLPKNLHFKKFVVRKKL